MRACLFFLRNAPVRNIVLVKEMNFLYFYKKWKRKKYEAYKIKKRYEVHVFSTVVIW